MREQLSLFPEEFQRPALKVLEASVNEEQECVRLDQKYEKTLPLEVQYHPECHKVIGMSASRVGDWAEKKVIAICMQLGIECYENVSCVGKADLVIMVNDALYMIDVKIASRSWHKSGRINWRQKHAEDIQPGVYGVALVPAATGIYCRWYNKYGGRKDTPIHPPGLRNLWIPSLPSPYRTVA